MVLIRGTYRFAPNPDGSCCFFILVNEADFVNALFPATATDTTTPIGAAENAGDVRTRDISTFLFPTRFSISATIQIGAASLASTLTTSSREVRQWLPRTALRRELLELDQFRRFRRSHLRRR